VKKPPEASVTLEEIEDEDNIRMRSSPTLPHNHPNILMEATEYAHTQNKEEENVRKPTNIKESSR